MTNRSFTDKFTLETEPTTWKWLDNGTVLIPAKFTRVGIFSYQFGDVYRPVEEVLKQDSVKSMLYNPFTDEHPEGEVNINNWYELSKGIILDAYVDGGEIAGMLLVWDSSMIETLKTKKELSMGYTADVIEQPGIFDGQEYSFIQKNIKYNHVSSVWMGRAGRSIRIDQDDVNNYLKGDGMDKEKDVKDSVKELKDGYEAKIAVLQKQMENLESVNKTLQDKLDVVELQETSSVAKSLGFTVDNAKNALEVKKEVVSKFLNMDAKELTAEYLNGAFNSIIALQNNKSLKDAENAPNKDENTIVIDVK